MVPYRKDGGKEGGAGKRHRGRSGQFISSVSAIWQNIRAQGRKIKLVDRNFQSPHVHLKTSNEAAVTAEILTQMQWAFVSTLQQLRGITAPAVPSSEVL